MAVEHYPNTTAFAREIAGGNAVTFNQLMTQAKACIQPGLNFYQQKFSVQFRNTVRAFKVARLCCPMQVQHLHPTAASLRNSETFHFWIMTTSLPTWPESYLTTLLPLMVLSWKMRKRSLHGGQPTVSDFHIGQV